MKKTTKVLCIAFAILSTTIVSAKKDFEPTVQGVIYAQQDAVVYYDSKRNSVKDHRVHYDNRRDSAQDDVVHYGSKSSNLKK